MKKYFEFLTLIILSEVIKLGPASKFGHHLLVNRFNDFWSKITPLVYGAFITYPDLLTQ